MSNNVPDDWYTFYSSCEDCNKIVHASEGECECRLSNPKYSNRPWLEDSGYEFYYDEWTKVVSQCEHVARRDHSDGAIKAGQRYSVMRTRVVNDETGKSTHHTSKRVVQ